MTIPAGTDHLATIADLLVDLPAEERQGVIADMEPSVRVAVAKLLVARLARKGASDA